MCRFCSKWGCEGTRLGDKFLISSRDIVVIEVMFFGYSFSEPWQHKLSLSFNKHAHIGYNWQIMVSSPWQCISIIGSFLLSIHCASICSGQRRPHKETEGGTFTKVSILQLESYWRISKCVQYLLLLACSWLSCDSCCTHPPMSVILSVCLWSHVIFKNFFFF